MVIKKEDLKRMFCSVADLMLENVNLLSEIDSKFGDGDHGVTIAKIANLIKLKVEMLENDSIKQFFIAIGNGITNINGGSAGPLYGTYFSGYAEALNDEEEIDQNLFKEMVQAGLEELQYITKAKVGDKTMMDALIPATNAIVSSTGDFYQMLQDGFSEAVAGAKASEGFISKFGRAKSYKEQTIGTPDAGAQSCALIFEGFMKGYKN